MSGNSWTLTADLIKDTLNAWAAGSRFFPGFVAESEPLFDLTAEALQTISVSVFPASIESVLADRDSEDETQTIAVTVAKHAPDAADVRALVDFMEEIKQFLTAPENHELDNALGDPLRACVELQFPVVSDPLFDLNLLRQSRIYLGGLGLPYLSQNVFGLPPGP